MAQLSIQQLTGAGLSPALVAAAGGGDSAAITDDNCFLYILNGGGASINVTLTDAGRTKAGNAGVFSAVAVPNGTTPKLIPLPLGAVDPATGLVSWAYSGVGTVTVGVVRR